MPFLFSSFIPYFEVNNMTLSQSVEAPLTLNDTVTFGGNIEAQNGNGNGNIMMLWKRLISEKSWTEVDNIAFFLGFFALLKLCINIFNLMFLLFRKYFDSFEKSNSLYFFKKILLIKFYFQSKLEYQSTLRVLKSFFGGWGS